jgi:hypothetical protein
MDRATRSTARTRAPAGAGRAHAAQKQLWSGSTTLNAVYGRYRQSLRHVLHQQI